MCNVSLSAHYTIITFGEALVYMVAMLWDDCTLMAKIFNNNNSRKFGDKF